MAGRHSVAVPGDRGRKCVKWGVMGGLSSDLPTPPGLYMVMRPHRKTPRMNEVVPWSSSISISTGRRLEHVSPLHVHRLRQDHMDSMERSHPHTGSKALNRNQVT